MSLVEVLESCGDIDQDRLAASFGLRYRHEPHRGYGPGAHTVLTLLSLGAPWRDAARAVFPEGSYGNGAAMRVAPIGGYFADDFEHAARAAAASAEVTHSHPEGQAGATAAAVAAGLAARPERPEGNEFLEGILRHVPDGAVREGIQDALAIPRAAWADAGRALGTDLAVSVQDTVPVCAWMAAHHLGDFETAPGAPRRLGVTWIPRARSSAVS